MTPAFLTALPLPLFSEFSTAKRRLISVNASMPLV